MLCRFSFKLFWLWEECGRMGAMLLGYAEAASRVWLRPGVRQLW